MKVLYRYQSLAVEIGKEPRETSKERTFDIIRTNSLRFSSNLDFQDMFDCRTPKEVDETTYADKHIASLEKSKKIASPLDIQLIEKSIRKLRTSSEFRLRGYRDLISKLDKIVGLQGIKSFCGKDGGEKRNNNMWLQYADRYRGICFIFNESDKLFTVIRKVTYFDSDTPKKVMPVYELLERAATMDDFKIMFCQKSSDFEYENEYRVIIYRGAGTTQSFEKKSLVGVQFGDNTSQEDERQVKRLLLEHKYPKVNLYKMKPNYPKANFDALKIGEIIT